MEWPCLSVAASLDSQQLQICITELCAQLVAYYVQNCAKASVSELFLEFVVGA